MTNTNNDNHHETNNAGAPTQPQQQQRQSNEEEQKQQQRQCTIRKCGSILVACDYCRGQGTSVVVHGQNKSAKCYYMVISSQLSAQIYGKLIDRGWCRAGGQVIFKRDAWNSCCPALAIRLPVAEFQPTNSQRRVLRKMQRLLNGEGHAGALAFAKSSRKARKNKQNYGDEIPILTQLAHCTRLALQFILKYTTIQQPIRFKTISTNDNTITAVSTICAAVAGPSEGKYDWGVLATLVVDYLKVNMKLNNNDSTKIIQLQAHEPSGQIICKLSTRHVRLNQSEEQNVGVSTTTAPEDALDKWFRTRVPHSAFQRPYTLTITTHPAMVSSLQPDVHQLFFNYQQKIHHKASPLSKTDEASWGDAPPEYIEQAKTMLQKTYSNLTPSEMLKMTSSFSFFYQFLVATPLSPIVENDHENHDTNNHSNIGTFHQHYRINGFLIAVGIVDIWSQGLSSVYAFYNAEFAHSLCPLGKFLVLKEIEYCRNLNLRYYYLGDFVHSCSKLRYKAEFHPSQLLCPTTSCWVDAQDGLATLDMESSERQGFRCRLYHGPVAADDAEDTLDVMETVLLEVDRSNPVTLSMLCPELQNLVRPVVEEFVHHVGLDVSRQCIIRFRQV